MGQAGEEVELDGPCWFDGLTSLVAVTRTRLHLFITHWRQTIWQILDDPIIPTGRRMGCGMKLKIHLYPLRQSEPSVFCTFQSDQNESSNTSSVQ